MNEKIYRIILAVFSTFSISIVALFCFFCIGLSRVDAATWIQINDIDGNYVCGSSSDIKDCIYGEYTNGSYNYKKLNDYLIILEDLETMKSNNTYEIELSWTLKTYAVNTQETDWITRSNYSTFTSYTQMNLQTANGQLVDDSTKAWSLIGWSLTGTAGTNSSFANLAYNYSNTFTPTTDTDRIVLRITKRSRWESIGTYIDFYGVSPEIEITNLTYTIRNISAPNQDIITNANQNTQDIINNQNQNTDKVVNAIEKSEETNQGILETITNFFSNFFEGLIGIFVPNNFDFLTGFLDTLENKLGFIASVPIQFLEFLANLVTLDFDTVSSVTLPHFEILGYTFIDEQEIDLSEIMAVFQPYRIYTNIGCVCLCIRYLMKLYENFANKE